MAIDRSFLAAHATLAHEGIEERAFHLLSGDGWCLAILCQGPEVRDPGYVVSHSLGMEFTSLRRVDRAVARTLAGLGHPVLALHRRGFGDSSDRSEDATLEGGLEDLRTGIRWMTAERKLQRVGLIGARSGGLMAGLVARAGVEGPLILLNPVTSGKTLLRQLVQQVNAVTTSSRKAVQSRSLEEVLAEMRRAGSVEALGYSLGRDLFEPLLEVDLAADMGSFGQDALILQVQKGTSVPRHIQGLAQRIDAAGGRCTVELLEEPPGTRFGYVPFVSVDDPSLRVDVQHPMTEMITAAVRRWKSP